MDNTTPAMPLLLLALTCGLSTAAEFAPAPMQPQPGTTARIASPTEPSYSLGMPSLERPPVTPQRGLLLFGHRVGQQEIPPSSGWTGYGFGGVPTYQWGYFGARYHPVKIYHEGYYGHRMSYGYRRGY